MDRRKLLRGVFLIAGLSFVLAGAVNFRLVRRYLRGEFRQGYLDRGVYPGIRFITLAEAEDLFARSGSAGRDDPEGTVFIDSRSRDLYAGGHIPGSRNIPLDEVSAAKSAGARLLAAELPEPAGRTLVIYCEGGDCQTSIALGRLIHDAGFTDIRIFSGGFAEWSAAGLPEEMAR